MASSDWKHQGGRLWVSQNDQVDKDSILFALVTTPTLWSPVAGGVAQRLGAFDRKATQANHR